MTILEVIKTIKHIKKISRFLNNNNKNINTDITRYKVKKRCQNNNKSVKYRQHDHKRLLIKVFRDNLSLIY